MQNIQVSTSQCIIYMYQSVFRMNHSTDFFLTQLTDFPSTCMYRQMQTGMILVGYQKAFDSLDRRVLLEKMQVFGFWASLFKGFESI